MPLALLLTTFAALAAERGQATATVYAFPTSTEATDILDQIGGALTSRQALDKIADLASSARFLSKKGDLVRIYCFYREDGTKKVEIQIDEKTRQPLIADQLKNLIRLARAVAADAPDVAGAPLIKVEVFDYKLKLPRATLKITAEIKDNPDNTELAIAGTPQWFVILDFTNGGETTNAGETTATILTGSREAFSISADVPLSSLGDVDVDEELESAELEETPETFYAALNYAPFGDVASTPVRFTEALTLKALLKASRRPTDSFGVGIGLRPGFFANNPTLSGYPFLRVLDTLSPYVAYTRTRGEEDQQNADGTTHKLRFKRHDVVIGISLDLEKALDFVSGDDEEEEKEP
ncbi:MAG TPA: hypothetical protein VEK79_03750 [Thermoanaerobaculia bacterium]|nr:hypothetical protein [Thermoanaerobaculia bacterium]